MSEQIEVLVITKTEKTNDTIRAKAQESADKLAATTGATATDVEFADIRPAVIEGIESTELLAHVFTAQAVLR